MAKKKKQFKDIEIEEGWEYIEVKTGKAGLTSFQKGYKEECNRRGIVHKVKRITNPWWY